jgi:hypothetical protein
MQKVPTQPRSLAPVTLLDLELWHAECLAALHKLTLPESFKHYMETHLVEWPLQQAPPDYAVPRYLPRNADSVCESDRPLEEIFSAPLALRDSSYRAEHSDWDDENRRDAVLWRERAAMLGYLTTRLQDEWRIVDQNVFTDKNEDLYTGCWFDFAVTNALHNYPKIATNMYALLRKYNVDTAHKRPCEFIRSLRAAFLLEVEQQVGDRDFCDPALLRLMKVLVFRFLMTTDEPCLKEDSDVVHEAYYHHMLPPFAKTLESAEYAQYSRQFLLTILDHEFEKVLEHPRAADLFDDHDWLLYIWSTYVFHEMLVSKGAERVYTQLIAVVFGFTIIEIESQCDDLMFDVAMELIHESPTAAFTLLRPGMHVARVGNLPRDARGLDAKTMYTFALVNNDTNKGHAMFITRGPCETTWTAPLN